MENNLEQLLNILIQRGWKPFGIYGNGDLEGEKICIEEQTDTNEYRNKVYYINVDYVEFNGLCDEDKNFSDKFSIRELTSKESGLWQFCCKNRLTHRDGDWSKNAERDEDGVIDRDCLIFSSDYEYWLIESALCDEDKLEQFLLDKIKIGNYES